MPSDVWRHSTIYHHLTHSHVGPWQNLLSKHRKLHQNSQIKTSKNQDLNVLIWIISNFGHYPDAELQRRSRAILPSDAAADRMLGCLVTGSCHEVWRQSEARAPYWQLRLQHMNHGFICTKRLNIQHAALTVMWNSCFLCSVLHINLYRTSAKTKYMYSLSTYTSVI